MANHCSAAHWAQALVQRCQYWLKQQQGPLTLGYSGGLDSTVLLAALLQAGAKGRLTAVHVHHGLQPLADTWLEYCELNACQLGVRFQAAKLALPGAQNIEHRARRARRAALLQHTPASGALLLAHHQNDQAETLLLQLLRGAGPQGLSAMAECSQYEGYTIVRPLLAFSRAQLEAVARYWQLDWVEDPTNQEIEADRNFLRQRIVPTFAERWPQVVPTLARNAELQNEAAALQEEVAQQDYLALVQPDGGVCLKGFARLSLPRQRNLLYRWVLARGWLPPSKAVFARVWQELLPARADAQPRVAWPEGSWCRFGQRLYLLSATELAATTKVATVALKPGVRHAWGVGVLSVTEGVSKGHAAALPRQWQSITLAPMPKGAKITFHGMAREVREQWRNQGLPVWRRQQAPAWFYQQQLVGAYGVGVSDGIRPAEGEPAWLLHWHWPALAQSW